MDSLQYNRRSGEARFLGYGFDAIKVWLLPFSLPWAWSLEDCESFGLDSPFGSDSPFSVESVSHIRIDYCSCMIVIKVRNCLGIGLLKPFGPILFLYLVSCSHSTCSKAKAISR